MPDYKEMYLKLFAACADMMEIMQKVTLDVEAMAMADDEAAPLVAAETEQDA